MSERRSEPERVTDAKTMRALAHPVRMALLDALRDEGEVTASRAAELLGDSPGNMSWHLQTLAKYGFVEEAGTGKGRSRPWRLVTRKFSFETGVGRDPEALAAGEMLEEALLNRTMDQVQEWRQRRNRHPEWAEEAFIDNNVVYMTPQELGDLSRQISSLLAQYDREDPATRPEGSAPVKFFGIGHPLLGDNRA